MKEFYCIGILKNRNWKLQCATGPSSFWNYQERNLFIFSLFSLCHPQAFFDCITIFQTPSYHMVSYMSIFTSASLSAWLSQGKTSHFLWGHCSYWIGSHLSNFMLNGFYLKRPYFKEKQMLYFWNLEHHHKFRVWVTIQDIIVSEIL